MPERLKQLQAWLEASCGLSDCTLEPASGDASFRRYFRIRLADGATLIAMDAPPEKEDCGPFVRIARELESIGLHVPRIHAEDLDQGFLLLEDLGGTLYLDALDGETADRLYGDAFSALAAMQARAGVEALPPYDDALLRQELELFRHWLCGVHLDLGLDDADNAMLDQAFDLLVNTALEQPRVFVHRDYHSRNLMLSAPPSPGILDFQDAVAGPVTYDLVSLLKDAYIRWPADRVRDWVWGYFELAVQSGVLLPEHEGAYPRWFDLMGVQRHVKVAGIFARLYRRDGKAGYLKDIPLVLDYILEVAANYRELSDLATLIETRVAPALARAA